ncbi:ATP-dependent DNA ligase [Burkholderiales bacterium 8X]|nr:ATP-dependent DNA ligase [Burkholderiales bacterium 8X]
MKKRRTLVRALAVSCMLIGVLGRAAEAAPAAAASSPPAVMLAAVYQRGMSLDDYWISEKFDGVRGYWDGRQLWTRGGHKVMAPPWFTAAFPSIPMDGELWVGRGKFETTVSIVRSQQPSDAAWRELKFMVFDLPSSPGDFTTRLEALKKLLPIPAAPWLLAVPQSRATHHEELQALLGKTVKLGGEGLMLHRGASLYRGERSNDLLKVKPHDDADARVVGIVPGKGRHAGRMGAIWVDTPEGRRFKIGSGFSDSQREAPPPVGSWISYRFNGTNASGLPRFARFLRLREDLGG